MKNRVYFMSRNEHTRNGLGKKKKNKKPQKSSTHDEKAILIGKGRNVTCAGNIYTNSSLEAGHTG